MQSVEIGGAVVVRVALRSQNALREFIPRRILLDLQANPFVVRFDRLGTQTVAGDEQQIGPFVGPVVYELRAPQQIVGQPLEKWTNETGSASSGRGG